MHEIRPINWFSKRPAILRHHDPTLADQVFAGNLGIAAARRRHVAAGMFPGMADTVQVYDLGPPVVTVRRPARPELCCRCRARVFAIWLQPSRTVYGDSLRSCGSSATATIRRTLMQVSGLGTDGTAGKIGRSPNGQSRSTTLAPAPLKWIFYFIYSGLADRSIIHLEPHRSRKWANRGLRARPVRRLRNMPPSHCHSKVWRRTLKWRSQKDGMTWERIKRLADEWLPQPQILHPWPDRRFAVRHPRWEPYARIGPVRICAGGAR